VEEAADPGVETRHDGILTHVDGLGVLFLAYGVLGGELAAVVGLAVVPGTLHSAFTQSTADQPGEDVGCLVRLRRTAARWDPANTSWAASRVSAETMAA
jgi:hypothetical protein